MPPTLRDHVALVTGAGSGIGRATAVLLAERGCHVVINDIDTAAAEDTAAAVRQAAREALVIAADVRDVAAIKDGVRRAEQRFGRIDILVNNAGVSSDKRALEDIDEPDFDRMFGVHVKGAFFATQAVVPGMKRRRSGKIINVSSNWALHGSMLLSHYTGAKAALIGLTKAWARELAPSRIRVNAVVPGSTVTPMVLRRLPLDKIREIERSWPLGRWLEPQEVAYSIAFLASPEADMITGQMLVANGGQDFPGP
jgi:3-oxoacyl-[acyl-carrier protein] reductase